MGMMQVAKGVAEFFNLSNVSKAFGDLGADSVNRLAMNVDRIQTSKSIIGKAVDAMSEAQQKEWGAIERSITKGVKGTSADVVADKMDDFLSVLTKDEKFMESARKNEAFTKALEEYGKKDKSNALKYFGREAEGNIRVMDKLNGLTSDPQYGGTRIKTGLAAAGGTALAVRYLSGGNLTTNARGEHDIAGIPII